MAQRAPRAQNTTFFQQRCATTFAIIGKGNFPSKENGVMCRMFIIAVLAALVGVASLTPPVAAQEEKPATVKETTELVIEGSLHS